MTETAIRPRRAALGGFLKARRARLSPQDVGLPPGPRRRTPGLRREEVALLAGVGITWYTWLEQGRPINASGQVLDAVARTLRLDRAEREHLYRLAEATPARTGVRPTDVPGALVEILHGLDPLPASLTNMRFDVIDSNAAHRGLFVGWHGLPCVHRNLLWCCVTEPQARERFLNYDEEVAHLVARLRSSYGRYVGDPSWEEDIRRLLDISPEFTDLWARHEVAEPSVRTHHFRHPAAGDLIFERTELTIASATEFRITVYTPQNDETRDRLPLSRLPT
ncbi:helix-turn-helix transcriptional regulator [Actinomadura sp. DC4]|uniref:helix-turn-helix transcriptional regulator n=1 Tax=Actinomadura sp. DC4 TaxID=3055069 RepID=UPI0025AF9102|nr:helix-turn-helix transcriptional regulator [Actinomadura sp. DC4]MDN3351680.1 helix-turn-helix transcriptional regulator [Actinomadura sp. DC4]